MRPSRFSIILTLLLLMTVGVLAYAQNQAKPLVGFVVSRLLLASSVADNGPDGVSRLGKIFTELGANTMVIRLDEPLPDNLDVIVLVSPLAQLSDRNVARIWSHLNKGGSLLVALDTNGYQFVNSERSNGGFNKLLSAEYNLSFNDNFLTEEWFSTELLKNLTAAHTLIYPEPLVRNPIVAPLVDREVPINMWAGRGVRVEPFGDHITASPLIYTDTAYGEHADLFRTTNPEPINLNIGIDEQPRLLVGGTGINLRNGSRVAAFGDGQIFENDFGLARRQGSDVAAYPGNELLIKRTAAWLLGIDEKDWPSIPAGYTWINVDGQSDDWNLGLTTHSSELPVRAFNNDSYLYMLIDAPSDYLSSSSEVSVTFDVNGKPVIVKLASDQAVEVNNGAQDVISDASLAVGTSLEMRIPLRIIGLQPAIQEVCIDDRSATSNKPQECLNETFKSTFVNDFDPSPLLIKNQPLVFVEKGTSTIYAGPDTTSTILGTAQLRTPFAVVSANAGGDWVEVENGRIRGWISRSALTLSGTLPNQEPVTVTDTPAPTVSSCSVSAVNTVNKRSGPSTLLGVAGQLQAGTTTEANAQAIGNDNRVWLRLADGTWIRRDTIVAEEQCQFLEKMTPK